MDWRRKAGDGDGRIDWLERRGDRVVVAFSWSESSGKRHEWAQVLELKDGKIVAMQDYAKPSRAGLVMRCVRPLHKPLRRSIARVRSRLHLLAAMQMLPRAGRSSGP
jgi:hypothetical protein